MSRDVWLVVCWYAWIIALLGGVLYLFLAT
jgi:hypothetical protein